MKPRGLLAFHVSSRFFDLPPVVARIAAERGLVCYVRPDAGVALWTDDYTNALGRITGF